MRRAEVAGAVAYLAAVIGVSQLAGPFWLFLLTSAVITAMVAVSVGVIYDSAGLLSLCQMTFAGIGAWTVGWLHLKTDLPFLALVPFAIAVPLAVGVAVGVPALRLRGQNLAVFTLVFGAAVARVIFADGFPGLIQGNRVLPPSFAAGSRGYFVFCAIALGAVAAAVTALRRVRMGRWWSSVRSSERATAAMGRSVVTTKLSAFAVSAGIAGLGGALLLAQNGIVSGASFQPIESMTILTAALMFGAGNLEGALLAGLFGQLIPNFLSDLGLPRDIAPMIFAIGGVIALSRGEGGLSAAMRGLWVRLRDGTVAVTPAAGGPEAIAGQRSSPRHPVASEPVLETRDLSVSYGAIRALDSVSLSLPERGFVGLIGPNGAGKSTLVDTLSGFVTPEQGEVRLAGEDITALAPHQRARLGLRRTFQQGHTPRDLNIGSYLDLASGGQADLVSEVLYRFSLPDVTTPINRLDVGTRRVLEACGALVSRPKIALLDEPTAGLSVPDSAAFTDALRVVGDGFGVAVLLIEHDLDVVASLCDTVVVLDFGRVIANGTPAEVLRASAVVAAYLGTRK